MNEKIVSELQEELEVLEEQNLLWNPKTLNGPSSARTSVAGKEVIMLCSNNYLGLANHKKLKKAAIEAEKNTVPVAGQ